MFGYQSDDHSLSGYTVLLPSLGVGNVGQLVVDLLVSALEMEKVAIAWHPAIVPIIGPNAFDSDSDNPTTSCELFVCRTSKLAVVQLRAPIVPAMMGEFFAQMMAHFSQDHVERLLVMTSSYAYEKHLVESSPFEYLANDSYQSSHAYFVDELGWTPFSGGDTIFGGGFAKRALDAANEHRIPAVVFLKYVSEGDNSMDAPEVCNRLDGFLRGALPKNDNGSIRLKCPVSWKLLFGNSAPEQLY